MAYRKFQTENAEYVLQLGDHTQETKMELCKDIFKGLNGMVIESGDNPFSMFGIYALEAHTQMQNPLLYCNVKSIPVYLTDSPSFMAFDLSPRSQLWHAPLAPVGRIYAMLNREIGMMSSSVFSTLSRFIGDMMIEGRNAFNAKKIEEFVVPRVKNISRKEKPKIGLIFGSMHAGIEPDLKSRKRREKMLSRTLLDIIDDENIILGGLEAYKEDLNKVVEARSLGGHWAFNEHDCGLFGKK